MKIVFLLTFALVSCKTTKKPEPATVAYQTQLPVKMTHPDVPPETVYEKAQLDYAVLFAVKQKLGDSLGVYSCSDLGKAEVSRIAARQRKQIECIRTWAAGLPNRQVADNYDTWLDYYLRQAQNGEDGCKPKEVDNEEVRRAKQGDSDMAAGRKLNIPKPRDCSPTELASQ